MRPASSPTPSPLSLNLCRGARGESCPYALPPVEGFAADIQQRVAASGWPEFLIQALNGQPLRHHHAFQIAVAGCANGCSRPHIADVAFIRSLAPSVAEEACVGCNACVETCPDEAIALIHQRAVIDAARCLRCGRCVEVCPAGAISGAYGWRVLVGGKLGRRPRLAQELPGLYDDGAALAVVDRALAVFMAQWRPGLRFGDLVAAHGPSLVLAETSR